MFHEAQQSIAVSGLIALAFPSGEAGAVLIFNPVGKAHRRQKKPADYDELFFCFTRCAHFKS